LEVIPRRRIVYRGIEIQEMDLAHHRPAARRGAGG
jgi:K+-sensing histidine kinase KdpD